nr:HupE/UreJ family protein [Desulfobacterales bacterium]
EFRAAMIYVVKIVTLFTIAHSVTLSIAALGIFDLPSGLVEPIIAASIAFAALDIIFPIFKRRIGWVVFVFGLFHGFGFASVLADLGVLGENMALSLLGFNLGVEIGQVVIICVIFPLIYVLRQFAFYPKIIMRYGAAAMILVATFWFVERTIVDFNVTRLIKNFFVNMTR